MKRRVPLILLLMSLLFLVACGEEEPPADEAGVVEEPTTEAPEVPTEEPALDEGEAEEATLPPPEVVEGEGEDAAEAPEGEAPEPAAPEAQEPETPEPVFPWPQDRFGYGVQVHGNASVGNPADIMDSVANQLGMQWVKVQLRWSNVYPEADSDQWFFYDGVIDEANRRGLNVLLSVVTAPQWTRAAGGEHGPPDDYSQYADFLTEMLARYEGKVHAVEVWNEQNLDREWSTAEGLSPEAYVEFLSVAHEAIKAQDPNIIVVSGALSPTGVHDAVTSYDDFQYMEAMVSAGMLDYADCVGAHHNGYNIPPDVPFDEAAALPEAQTAQFRGPFDNPHHSWSFRTTLDTYAETIQAADPEAKLCVTEFGWPSSEGYDQAPEGFGFAMDNTLEEQAQYIVQAFQQMHDSGNVWLAFLFNYDFGNKGSGPTDDTVPYSIIDMNGSPRPAFQAVADMEKAP
ncbi:MAG: cellulase family glycosylhydrolase [Chloroflexota bacterium]